MIKGAWILLVIGSVGTCIFPPFTLVIAAAVVIGIVAVCKKKAAQGIALIISGVVMMPICLLIFAAIVAGAVSSKIKPLELPNPPKTERLRLR
jgi:type III secretory pathway component EscR